MSDDDEIEDGDILSVEQPGGYDQLPTAVWYGGRKHGAAAPGEVVAYIALRRFGTMRLGRAIPSRGELAKDMGISVGAVDERMNGLIERGWLLITPRFRRDGQGQASNHYQLLWDPIVSEDDARLAEHRRRVTEFEAWMEERVAARADSDRPEGKRPRSVRSAGWDPTTTAKRVAYWREREEERRRSRGGAENWAGVGEGNAAGREGAQKTVTGGAENCDPPSQETVRAGAQKTVPLEPHPYGVNTHRGEPTSTAAADAPTGRLTATVVDSTGTASQEVDLFGVVDAEVVEDEPGEPDMDAERRKVVRTLVAAYVDVVTARGGHCTQSILASIGNNIRRVVRNDKIPEGVLLVAAQKAATRGERSLDRILAAPDGPQASWDRSPAARRAMEQSWLDMGRKLDEAAQRRSEGVA